MNSIDNAWNEVFIGKWVPVDSTWMQVGRIDATHIEFFKTVDNSVTNNIIVSGSVSGEIVWTF